MNCASRVVITAALLLGGVVQPAPAAVPAPGPTAAVDTLHAPGAPRAPSALQLEFLRRDIGGHSVRVWAGGERFEAGSVRLGAAGVEFEREPGRPDFATQRGGPEAGDRAEARAPTSPASGLPPARLAWERVDRIDALRSSAMMGFAAGALVSVAGAAYYRGASRDPMVMVFYCFLTVPATLAASTFIGAIVPHWKCLWVRPAPASKVNG